MHRIKSSKSLEKISYKAIIHRASRAVEKRSGWGRAAKPTLSTKSNNSTMVNDYNSSLYTTNFDISSINNPKVCSQKL